METTVFNPIQRHLLEMFSYDKSQEGLEELKEVLLSILFQTDEYKVG